MLQRYNPKDYEKVISNLVHSLSLGGGAEVFGLFANPDISNLIYGTIHSHIIAHYYVLGSGYKRIYDVFGPSFFAWPSPDDFKTAVNNWGLLKEAFNLPDDKVPDLVAGGVLAYERQAPSQKEIRDAVQKTLSHIPIFKIDKDGIVTKLSKGGRDDIVESKPLTQAEIRKISEIPEKVVLGGHKLAGKSYLNYREMGSDKNLAQTQKLMDLAEKAIGSKKADHMIEYFKHLQHFIEPEAPSLVKRVGSFVTPPTLGVHYSERDLLSKTISVRNNVFPMLAYRMETKDFGIVLISPQTEGREYSYNPSTFISRDGPDGGKIITPYDKPLSGFLTKSGKSKLFLTDVHASISDDDLKQAIISSTLTRSIDVFNDNTGEFQERMIVLPNSLTVGVIGTAEKARGSVHVFKESFRLALLGENGNSKNKDSAMLSPTAGPPTFR